MKASLPHYRHWNQVPEDLATRTELGKEGLQPGGAPVATMAHGAKNRQPVELFPRSEAIPKRRASERELNILHSEEERQSAAEEQLISDQVAEWKQATHRELLELSRLPADRWVTLDTETTELIGEAISISVVSGTGEVLFDRLIQPLTPITREAFEVHGISMQDLAEQPTFAEVHGALGAVLEGKTVLAFNADFDHSTLQRTRKRHGIAAKDFPVPGNWHCLMLAASALFGKPEHTRGTLQSFRYLSLQKARIAVARALKKPLQDFQAHSSLGDALATRELALMLFEFASKAPSKGPEAQQSDGF